MITITSCETNTGEPDMGRQGQLLSGHLSLRSQHSSVLKCLTVSACDAAASVSETLCPDNIGTVSGVTAVFTL